MKRWTFFFAATCAASIAAGSTAGAFDHYLSGYAGAYNCTSGNDHYTVNITSQLDGRAIRVDSHASYADSEYIITYVPQRNVYIAEYADSRGGYETMEGKATGRSINFREVYPSRTDTMVENFPSGNMFSEVYTTISNGKTQSVHEACTKR
jgi:hypothetical protein